MPDNHAPEPPADLDVAAEVAAILAEYFPHGLASPTTAALARGRARVICRDAANDDYDLTLLSL